MIRLLTEKASNLLRHKSLIWRFVSRDVRQKYVGSFLGFFWAVIHPLVLLAIFTFVFGAVLKVRFTSPSGGLGDDYVLFMFCGFVPWLAFQEAVIRSTNAVQQNANLIKNMIFPAKVLSLYLSLSALFQQLIGLVILAVAMFLTGQTIGAPLVCFPFLVVLQIGFSVGLGWITGALQVFFRDVAQVVGALLLIWMYGTPIFYPQHMVPKGLTWIVTINPMAHLVEMYRDVLLRASWPNLLSLGLFAVCALALFALGLTVFERLQPRFADSV